jgi:anhydro-N-acetylmuramic acid kinase
LKTKYTIIGLMSGTSLDGLDIALCEFEFNDTDKYQIIQSLSAVYNEHWRLRLSNAHTLSGLELSQLDIDLGVYFGEQVFDFLKANNLDRNKIDAIASHGHTVFHQPETSLTLQIGKGSHITAITGIDTICDFRTTDVAKGGQGAPLVPVGDLRLFSEYDYCLNIGGIANVSFTENGDRISFDIGIANMASNYLCRFLDIGYDAGGQIANSGNLILEVFEKLNALPYFAAQHPKSIGREFFESELKPLLDLQKYRAEDLLHTFGKHLAFQLSKHIISGKVLVTGGGAFNTFWMDELKILTNTKIVIPDSQTIEFKEALIFAFLGALYIRNENNCLSSVTGADSNAIGGCLYRG